MIIQMGEQAVQSVKELRGGKGTLSRKDVFTEEQMLGKALWFITLTIPPGASIGQHPHDEDAEIYYILSGSLRVTDDGITKDLSAGDAVFTSEGKIHGVENISDDQAVLLAVRLP